MASFNQLLNTYISSSVDIETYKTSLFLAERSRTSTKSELKNKIEEVNLSGSAGISPDFLAQGPNYITRNGLGFEIYFESRSMDAGGSYITKLKIHNEGEHINVISFD